MTRAEIIAELRRSAREDADPCIGLHEKAWDSASRHRNWLIGESIGDMDPFECANFFLLCAHALEDE